MKKLNFTRLKSILLDYPFVVLSSLLCYILIIGEIENYDFKYDSLGIIFSSGISLFFGLRMLSIKTGKIWLLRLIGFLLLLIYFLILPFDSKDFTDITFFIIFPVYVFLHLFVAVAKYSVQDQNEILFWNYNKNLFINFATSVVFSGILVSGVLSVLYTCDELFKLDIDSDFYFEVIWFILIIGNTIIFLLFDHKTEQETKEEEIIIFPTVLKFLTQYVLIPIMFLYTLVLYVYSIKILINWELPEGWLSYGILSYSIVGILALLLVYPLRDKKKKSWVGWFYKLFFYSLLPLLVLLFIAIYTRLLAYGFTEPRYFVLALTFWLTTVTLYFLIYKNASINFIPKSLMIMIIIALVFPYYNAFSVSTRSQKEELHKILQDNDLLVDGKIDFNSAISIKTIDEINSKYRFLKERNEDAFFKNYLNNEKLDNHPTKDSFYYLSYTDFPNRIYKNDSSDMYASSLNIYGTNRLVVLDKNTQIWSPARYDTDTLYLNNDTLTLINFQDEIKITLNDKKHFDLLSVFKEYLEKKQATSTNGSIHEEIDKLNFKDRIGSYKIDVYIDNLSMYREHNISCTIKYIIIEKD